MSDNIWENQSSLQEFLQEVIRELSQKTKEDGTLKYKYRNVWNMPVLEDARKYIEKQLTGMGYEVENMDFTAEFGPFNPDEDGYDLRDETVNNLIAQISGDDYPGEIVIIGAHYDSRTTMYGDNELDSQRGRVPNTNMKPLKPHRWKTPGANDNGSGIATMLALAHAFKGTCFKRTLRFVAWVNEEYPFYANYFERGKKYKGKKYKASGLGSYKHAERCAGNNEAGPKENIVGVISFDTLGCYPRDGYVYPGRSLFEKFLLWTMRLPKTGDFVAFLSNAPSRKLTRRFGEHYNKDNPEIKGVPRSLLWITDPFVNHSGAWSDDWSYWQFKYPGFAVTDTAYIRSERYHRDDDTFANINFPEFTQVVWRLRDSVKAFANREF